MHLKIIQNYTRRTLVRDLTVGLALTVIIVLALLGSLYYFFYTAQLEHNLENQAEEIVEELAGVLSAPLWNLDWNTVEKIGAVYRRTENVVNLRVMDDTDRLIYENAADTRAEVISTSKPIIYEGQPVGRVEISLAKQRIEQARQNILYSTLIAGGAVILGIVVITQILLRRFLMQPLAGLAFGIDTIAAGNYTHLLPPLKQADIDFIAHRVNVMAGQIAERDRRLRELIGTLEQEIAERKRAEEELEKYREHLEDLVKERTAALEEVNAELSQYAYVVSHDLRAPLRAIHNYADFLHEDLAATLEGDQKMYLNSLGQVVQEAEGLVEDLLELSRVGRHSASRETVDLGVFLCELVDSLKLALDVQIIVGSDWPPVEAEPALLRQIFQNLIDNAVKFNPSPLKRIELGWRPAGEEAYEFFVRDNGLGIASRYHEQIFRVFERLHTQAEYEGTGIGLAIVKKAVGKLHGSIRLESEPGQGSTFFVTLPKTRKENNHG